MKLRQTCGGKSGVTALDGNICILPMEERHLDKVCELEKVCFSSPWSKASLESESKRKGSFFAVAEINGEVAGYAGTTSVLDEADVTNIAVFPQYRRLGIGRMLLHAQKEFCLENKMAFLTLEVRESNVAAIGLYQSEGFEKVGKRKGYYRDPVEDAILMTCFFK